MCYKSLYFLKKRWIWITIIVAIVLPLFLYFMKFHRYQLSGDPSDWGVFGDYIGGVYSVIIAVLVVYLGHNLQQKDEEKKAKQEAIRAVYKQITSIQLDQKPNQNKVSKLFRLIEDCRLYIDDDFYDKLKELANYFVERGRNRELEKSIKDDLKSEYSD